MSPITQIHDYPSIADVHALLEELAATMPPHVIDRGESDTRTPYAVFCPYHGLKYLTPGEYDYQLGQPDLPWHCPVCGELAYWDDENYETYYDVPSDDKVSDAFAEAK